MQNKLAIAIPTYNRAKILEFNLLQILDELIAFEIPVYISDDSTNEETASVIAALKIKHPLFYYRKNDIRLGHDLNCVHTISFPIETYVWYLGDSMIIKKGSIGRLIACVQDESYDFISFNAERQNLFVENKVYNSGNDVFIDLCWHLTMTGATVYNIKKILDLKKFKVENFKNFPQTAIIFEQFAAKESKLLWINENLISGNKEKSSYWAFKVFDVFIDDYKNFVHNLSTKYPINSKDKVVSMHTILSGIFNYHSFVKYRIQGIFNYKVYLKHKKDFKKYTNLNTGILFVLSLFPIFFLKSLYKIIFLARFFLKGKNSGHNFK